MTVDTDYYTDADDLKVTIQEEILAALVFDPGAGPLADLLSVELFTDKGQNIIAKAALEHWKHHGRPLDTHLTAALPREHTDDGKLAWRELAVLEARARHRLQIDYLIEQAHELRREYALRRYCIELSEAQNKHDYNKAAIMLAAGPALDLSGRQVKRMVLTAMAPIAPEDLPPIPWLYGNFLLTGAASTVGGLDGTGKGFVTTLLIISMVTGVPLLGEPVHQRGRVCILTYEDDVLMWQRRIAAACVQYADQLGMSYQEVLEQIRFIERPDGEKIVLATMEERHMVFPHSADIIRLCREFGAVLLVVDPFNNCHCLDDGNNNTLIAQIAQEVTRMARGFEGAALTLHHLRKGATGRVEDLMGATTLRSVFRHTAILWAMTPDHLAQLQQDGHLPVLDGEFPLKAKSFLRFVDHKENYALSENNERRWMRIVSRPLGNGRVDPRYPKGDWIGVVKLWEAPEPAPAPQTDDIDPAVRETILQVIEAGLPGSSVKAWRASSQAKDGWVGKVFMQHLRLREGQADQVLKDWLRRGWLYEAEEGPKSRKIPVVLVYRAADESGQSG